ncbi:MAG: HEAT repeat domain-containing protein [Bacteroidota bacterium]
MGRNIARKRSELAPVISNFLFHSPEDPKTEQQEYVILKINIREYLYKRKYRRVLSQILLDLQKDVAGVTRERLYKLYLELGLHHDALAKLKSWRWYVISQGIQELSQMKVPNAEMLIRKFINDKRGVVRKQAELSVVGSKPEGIDYFLDTTTCSISEWQQLKLIETLRNIPNYCPPRFCNWLLSNNKDVVLFALRLIKHYNQKGAEAAITELVKHKNDQIKVAAIQCIIDFNFEAALDLLSKIYPISKESVKIAVLNAFMALGNEKNISFLQNIATTESNFLVRTKALATINAIRPESVLPSSGLIEIANVDQHNTEVPVAEIQEEDEVPQREPVEISTENDVPLIALDVVDAEEVQGEDPAVAIEQVPAVLPEFAIDLSKTVVELSLPGQLDEDESPPDLISKPDLEVAYNTMSEGEKQQLIEAFEDNTDDLSSKEHALVAFVAQEETNSELGYRAFSILRTQIQQEATAEETVPMDTTNGEELPLAQHTIFYELYHHASDLDSRLILLKEMAAIGDNKELPFLYELTNDPHAGIRDAVDAAITAIKNNVAATLISNPVSTADGTEELLELQELPEDHRLPLELAFLYEEVGILPASEKQSAAIFDFDLSEAFEPRSDIEKGYHG